MVGLVRTLYSRLADRPGLISFDFLTHGTRFFQIESSGTRRVCTKDFPMKILFLHGWHSVPGGLKPSYLVAHGHEVINPALDDDGWTEALRTAQRAFDEHQPDVIVGSSRGGAVAMNLDAGPTPLVLLCPAWKRWGSATTVKPGTVILHSEADEVVPIDDSRQLVRASRLPESALRVVGTDHRLADPEPLAAMLEACERGSRSE
jgi:hypothetical protein